LKSGTSSGAAHEWQNRFIGITSLYLGFDIDSGARFVRVTLRIRNDMATSGQTDDITMDFVSSVDLRE